MTSYKEHPCDNSLEPSLPFVMNTKSNKTIGIPNDMEPTITKANLVLNINIKHKNQIQEYEVCKM
jgi:hypothetical protein